MLKTTGSNNIDEIPSYKSRDSVVFPIGIDLEGDILIRVRNASSDGTRVSLLRFTFYIGYIENFNFRCAKVDLDGALNDDRFSPEFHIDLVFSEAKSTKPALSSDFFSQISQRQVAAPSERGFSGQKTTEVIDDVNLAQAQLTTDVDALISDLGIDDDIDNLDDDTDQLLAQLQEEIQNENTSPDRPATTQKTKETELDAEINKLLASS